MWEEQEQDSHANSGAEDLDGDERQDGTRRNASESVTENTPDGHGRVRERRRGREPIRSADIGTDRRAAKAPRLVAAREKISRTRPAVATTSANRSPAVARRPLVEMEVPTSNIALARTLPPMAPISVRT